MIQATVMDAIPWASWIPAFIAAVAAAGVAIWKSRTDLNALRTQVAFKNEDTLNSLQAQYIAPLRSATVTLSSRMDEIKQRFEQNDYGEVRGWFKEAKDHVVGDKRRPDFQKWCYYEGTFAVSTIYYTGVYFRCAHDISAHTPFRQLASGYSSNLEHRLERVRDAFDWGQHEGKPEGIWAPIQDVLGQRFMSAVDDSDTALLSYRDMCELLDSAQPLKYGPFMRVLDVYWEKLQLGNVQAIRAELDNMLTFIEEHPLREELRQ